MERQRRAANILKAKEIEHAGVVIDGKHPRVRYAGGKVAPKTGLSDGEGLTLNGTKSGRLMWEFGFQWKGKGKRFTLGEYIPGVADSMGLEAARAARNTARAKVRANPPINPIDERKAAQAGGPGMTVAQYALKNVAALAPTKAHGRNRWVAEMTRLMTPLIHMPMHEITVAHVKAWVTPRMENQTTWDKLGKLRRLLFAARIEGLIPGDFWVNPAIYRDHLQHTLPKRRRHSSTPRASLPYEQMPLFIPYLRSKLSHSDLPHAVEFTILSCVRKEEAFGARWTEFDFKRMVWTVPAERMKGKAGEERAHEVPISLGMLRVLNRVRPRHKTVRPNDYVFVSSKSKKYGRFTPHASNGFHKSASVRLGVKITLHGFRASFFRWGVEHDHQEKRLHLCLAHIANPDALEGVAASVDRAYNYGTQLEKRRAIMAEWSRYVLSCGRAPAVVTVTPPQMPEALPLAA